MAKGRLRTLYALQGRCNPVQLSHAMCRRKNCNPTYIHCHKTKIGCFTEGSSCAAGKVPIPYTITILQQGLNASHHVLQGTAILHTITTIRQVLGGSLRAFCELLEVTNLYSCTRPIRFDSIRFYMFNVVGGNWDPTGKKTQFCFNATCAGQASQRVISPVLQQRFNPVQLLQYHLNICWSRKPASHQADQLKQHAAAARSSDPCQIQKLAVANSQIPAAAKSLGFY